MTGRTGQREREDGAMVTLVFCLRRLPSLSRAEFQAYWRDRHGPLMRRNMAAFGARRYVQLHTLDGAMADFIATSRGTAAPYDGVVIVEWDDMETFARFNDAADGRAAGREMYKDELNFIDLENSAIMMTEARFEADGPA
jgi:uncharacterized protein (TIGR02118 family)